MAKLFSRETLIRSASSKALAATTEARIGCRHGAAWDRYGFLEVGSKGTGDDLTDAKPSLLALTPVVRSMPVPMQTYHLEARQECFSKTSLSILQEVEIRPVVKSKVLHFFRNGGVILLASGGAGRELLQGCGTGEKGYHNVESGARHHFIIGFVTDLDDQTVQMEITKGLYGQALAPLHQSVLDALWFEKGRGPVFSYEDTDAVILHAKLAAAVIDTLLSMQL
ncbi:TPA: hypothetical protein ACH3X1_011770 [Trebouxia sp. C0004]